MSDTHPSRPSRDDLRRRAEERLRKTRDNVATMSQEEVQQLVHELQVHQVELEIQNEELRQAQVELADARDRYHSLYEFAPVGYLTLDSERRILESNLTAATILGVERASLVGNRLGTWIHPRSADSFHRFLLLIDHAQESRSCELRFLHESGERLYCHVESRPSEEGQGGFWLTITNITARKEAEKAAAEARARYEEIVECAMSGIWLVDTAASTTYVNPHMAYMLGYHRDEIVGRNAFEFVVDGARDRARLEFEERKRQDSGEILEFSLRHRNGMIVNTLVTTINLRNSDGSIRGMLAMVTDVTQLKRMEMELNRSLNELREANAELSRFNRAAVDRELRMIELKKEVNGLSERLGLPKRYPLDFDE